uniref:Ig-like domain-containing protein n=1 Tax=Zosterops lateralis melanops TaxID=1220523 RepID=A0A8D2QTX8_ZOSLA
MSPHHCSSPPPYFPIPHWVVLPVPEGQVAPGDCLVLSCAMATGTGPLTFTWHQGRQLDSGPHLELRHIGDNDSGHYHCRVSDGDSVARVSSYLCLSTGVPLSGVSLWAQPPGGQVALGDRLVLNCEVATGTGPLSFSWHWGGSGAPLGTGPRLELQHVGDNDSGYYQCRVSNGDSEAESVPLNVTVLGECHPRAGGDPTHSIPIPPHQVPALSLPLWAQPLSPSPGCMMGRRWPRVPSWSLGMLMLDIQAPTSAWPPTSWDRMGTACSGHSALRVTRLFRTPGVEGDIAVSPCIPSVAVNVGRTLLFLVLLLAVIGGCHCWHHRGG